MRLAERVTALGDAGALSPQRQLLIERIGRSLEVLGWLDRNLGQRMARGGPSRQALAVIQARAREVALLVRMLEALGLEAPAPSPLSLTEYVRRAYAARRSGADTEEGT